jgi:molecular chaperone DnaK
MPDHFGIDFGTTNSCAVEFDTGSRIGDGFGRPMPSIIAVDPATRDRKAGREIWNRRMAITDLGGYRVVDSIKLLLEKPDQSPIPGFSVAELVAIILQELSSHAERARGIEGGIRKATFSIPVKMSPAARGVLREAAGLAGIQVTAFVKEPTAAVIHAWRDVCDRSFVAVFDWGGGTLDISVVEIRGRSIRELRTDGLSEAGNRIDWAIASMVNRRIMKQRGLAKQLEELPAEQQDDLRYRCELAKCDLARNADAFFALQGYDGRHEQVILTRDECAREIQPFVERALDRLGRTIKDAVKRYDAIDEIVVTGGCSQLWLLREMLGNDPRFAGRYMLAPDPEWAVARGAAILESRPGAFELAESIRLELSDGDHIDLAVPGDRPGRAGTLSLQLVEDAREAHILINRCSMETSERIPELSMTVPAQGFLDEEIHLRHELTSVQTFRLEGRSKALSGRGLADLVAKESGELRFSYQLPEGF